MVGAKRKKKIMKDISETAKLCHLGSGLLYRFALGDNYEEILKTAGHGKPYVDNGIKFNISHTADYAVLYVGKNECGIDIEKINPGKVVLSQKIFSEKELEWINEDTTNNFFYGWTRKESIAKAMGTGLTFPLKNIPIIKDKILLNNLEIFTESFCFDKHIISVSEINKKPDIKLKELDLKDF